MHFKYHRVSADVIRPRFATPDSACFDVCAYFGREHRLVRAFRNSTNGEFQAAAFPETKHGDRYSIIVEPATRYLIPTGLFFDMEPYQAAYVHSRSGMALKQGLVVANGVGVIDADYTQEVFVILENRSGVEQKIVHGDRIAQVRIDDRRSFGYEPGNPIVDLIETTDEVLQKTTRDGGFGSTGR